MESLLPPGARSRDTMLSTVNDAIQHRYSHLNAHFYPDYCMQVKIQLSPGYNALRRGSPDALLDILRSESFFADEDSGSQSHRDTHSSTRQYTLNNREATHAGCNFILKAALGPTFISFWFRNTSTAGDIDTPVLRALNILDRINEKMLLLTSAEKKSLKPSSQQREETMQA